MRALVAVLLFLQLQPFGPAQLIRADAPALPVNAIGWSEAVVVGEVDRYGLVSGTVPVSGTAPFIQQLQAVVRGWRFNPGMEDGSPVATSVLVVAVMRPRTLYDLPGAGVAAHELAGLPNTVPRPDRTVVPAYPIRAVGDGTVIVELPVGADGRTMPPRIVASAPGFDKVAAHAAGQWTFRPAVRGGRPVAAHAYVVFGFRSPVITSPR